MQEIVAEFAARRQRLATPAGSFDRCRRVADELTEALREAGTDAVVLRVQGFLGDPGKAHVKWRRLDATARSWTHYVVLVDGAVVDLTHAQFDPDAPFPLVMPLADVGAAWSECVRLDSEPDFGPPPRLG
jgi:hypothetical protein